MGDGNPVDSKTFMSTSMEDMQRRMVLLEIEENEKSSFDDVITGAESDNGWEDCWKETEDSVRSAPSKWLCEQEELVEQLAPESHYQLMDLNREPVRNFQTTRVPSQYQLDALSEMFIFDVPQHYTIVNPSTNCQPIIPTDEVLPAVDYGTTPFLVNSEYVSELLL